MRRSASASATTTTGHPAGRRGSSYLEVQIAFTVLGVSLAGLTPAVVSQVRVAARVDALMPPGGVLYLVPPGGTWAQKLGVDAGLSGVDPGPPGVEPGPSPSHSVEVVLADLSGTADRASVEVLVEAIP